MRPEIVNNSHMIGLFSHLTKSTICVVEINIMFTAHIHTHKHLYLSYMIDMNDNMT